MAQTVLQQNLANQLKEQLACESQVAVAAINLRLSKKK